MRLKVLHFVLTMVLAATVLMPCFFLLMRFGGLGFFTSALCAIVIYSVVWLVSFRFLVRRYCAISSVRESNGADRVPGENS